MRGCCCFATVVLSLATFQSAAQTAPPAGGPAPLSAKFPCDAFVKNPDGSWTPTRDVNIAIPNEQTVVTVGPAASFRRGADMRGFDLAALIERECRGG